MAHDPILAFNAFGVVDEPNGGDAQTLGLESFFGQLRDSAFNVLILSSFHVDAVGTLEGRVPLVRDGVFNPEGAVNPALPRLCHQLADQGMQLFYSVGNASGTLADLTALREIFAPYPEQRNTPALRALEENLLTLAREFSLTGIDFDFKPVHPTPWRETLVRFTRFVHDLGLQVTYSPFRNPDFWIDVHREAQAGIEDPTRSVVRWYNLQTYGGGATPSSWVQALVDAGPETLVIRDPESFILPGLTPTDATATPAAVRHAFAALQRRTPGLRGGFLWHCGRGPALPLEGYAQAILDGLGPMEPLASATVNSAEEPRGTIPRPADSPQPSSPFEASGLAHWLLRSSSATGSVALWLTTLLLGMVLSSCRAIG